MVRSLATKLIARGAGMTTVHQIEPPTVENPNTEETAGDDDDYSADDGVTDERVKQGERTPHVQLPFRGFPAVVFVAQCLLHNGAL